MATPLVAIFDELHVGDECARRRAVLALLVDTLVFRAIHEYAILATPAD